MVQTSNEQSRETNVSVRAGLKYYESSETQKYSGWYWCSDRKAFYRWDKLINGEK